MANEEKKKESSDTLPVSKTPNPIESPEEGRFVKRRTSIPGGLIQNKEVDEENIIIPTKDKYKTTLETVDKKGPILPEEKEPEKDKQEEFKAVVKSHKAEKTVKKSQREEKKDE
ncbi:hypothetical protein O181_007097 [Austropuccinia psidii MF-1]|uniref:Uncharacterized protein n=1 Tax=Austropuccinia psidii MF-1 TaxID=1389203 RepID=A0A9Q3GI57_9BASI|nr:hypothetical protein [Austropuccinia psidii MF-1]